MLHLGDLVDSGREAQYPVYKDIRKTIRKPVYEIPGNHDPQELFEEHIRKPIELAFDHKGVRFLMLNNSRTDLAGGGFQRGYVHGSTDIQGQETASAPCTPDGISATLFHCLGIDPHQELQNSAGRAIQLFREGRIINKLLA